MVFPIAMGWRDLLFASWPVDPAVVERTLPHGLTVDTFEGDAWLSVVPFTNVDVRPLGVPPALGFDLPELNLRTYVTHDGDPGVYFYNLDADGRLGVWAARLFHRLPYYEADMDYRPGGDQVYFRSRRTHPGEQPARFEATYGPDGDPFAPERDSLAWFLVERYRYYTASRGRLRYADVDHDRWTLQPAWWEVETNDLFRTNGFEDPAGEPSLLYSRGVDTVATRNKRV